MSMMKYNDILKMLAAVAIVAMPMTAVAQDFEDDIYYNPSKDKTTKTKKTTAPVKYVPTPDYPAADTYTFSGTSTRDVDEYNRRYTTVATDTMALDSAYVTDNFAYTRRIERFHNPDVVTASGDEQLMDYYYSQPAETSSVNIYLNTNPYIGWGYYNYYPYSTYYGYPYYGYPYYSYSYYRPWWSWSYDPWYWGYDPYWYGGWGYPYWSWSAPRPPHYHPGHGPGPDAWRPTSPGAYRPHGTASSGSTSGRRPGSSYSGSGYTPSSGSGVSRPGNMGRGRGYTPSSSSSSTRPGGYTPSSSSNRSSSTSGYNSTTRGRSGSSSTESRRNTYTPSRSSSSSSSGRGSYSTGGSRSSGGGGATRGGGGGGGRGRR